MEAEQKPSGVRNVAPRALPAPQSGDQWCSGGGGVKLELPAGVPICSFSSLVLQDWWMKESPPREGQVLLSL